MCVISDDNGALGLGGIIGGIGTELDTKNTLIESAHFDPGITRKTAKELEINSDAKLDLKGYRSSISKRIEIAAKLIIETCGGVVSTFDIQDIKTSKFNKFDQISIKLLVLK